MTFSKKRTAPAKSCTTTPAQEEPAARSTWEQLEAEEAAMRAKWGKIHQKRKRAVDEARAKAENARVGRRSAGDGAYQGVSRSEYREREKEALPERAQEGQARSIMLTLQFHSSIKTPRVHSSGSLLRRLPPL